MEEKLIIKSEQYDVKKFFKVMVIIGVALALLWSILLFSGSIEYYSNHKHEEWCYSYDYRDDYWDDFYAVNIQESKMNCANVLYGNAFSYALSEYFGYQFWMCLIPIVALAAIGGLIYLWLRSYEMTVTDKRVYGKVAWGKRVDLPLDSISSTATISVFRGVAVATSSGRIKFLMVKNSAEIFEKVNALLVERQKAEPKVSPVQVSPSVSSADELKKFKELLDSGIITQEEFDAKKKQLLGL